MKIPVNHVEKSSRFMAGNVLGKAGFFMFLFTFLLLALFFAWLAYIMWSSYSHWLSYIFIIIGLIMIGGGMLMILLNRR